MKQYIVICKDIVGVLVLDSNRYTIKIHKTLSNHVDSGAYDEYHYKLLKVLVEKYYTIINKKMTVIKL